MSKIVCFIISLINLRAANSNVELSNYKTMKITYLGHACFHIEINGTHLIVDPFISGNELAKNVKINSLKADYILITHGHQDHVLDVEAIANNNPKATLVSNYEIIEWFGQKGLKGHPKVKFVGFCDVDTTAFRFVKDDYPDAFNITDYREAFADRVDQFDAVIVDTPDFHHCPMMVTALKHGKHVYGQKPLVHQLDELRIIREAVAARPELYTQMGNQRACTTGRMQATEILKSNQLGRPVEAYIWTSGMKHGTYFVDPWSEAPLGIKAPFTMKWDLWHGPLQTEFN